jgi:hypothetical protein
LERRLRLQTPDRNLVEHIADSEPGVSTARSICAVTKQSRSVLKTRDFTPASTWSKRHRGQSWSHVHEAQGYVSFSVSLSVVTSVCVCICMYVFMYIYIYIYVCERIYVSTYLSIYLPTHPPIYLPIYLPTCVLIYLSIHLSTYLPF